MRQTFVLANAFKEGDLLVGGTRDDRVRADARRAILGSRILEIRRTRFVDDGVSEALERSLDRRIDAEIGSLTIEQLKAMLLGADAADWIQRHRAIPSRTRTRAT